ncbi:MAG: F0F1 ATP synthase subunit B [Lachnospiraceae bacterium]|jgi:F-type H+-transporting ATPase subunit b|nr:F0F1 ATP synthase subunit B [Lachnospiraceae bacterium]
MVNPILLTEAATQDLVTINWTFIAQICNLFIQMLLIKKFLFKPVREILAKRQAKADADIREAAEAKEEAAAIKAEYEQNMLEAKEKANELLAAAQKNAAAKSDEMIREASAEATAIKQKAEADIAQERRKAVNELKDEIGSMAMDIAGKVIEREINEKDHTKLIDEFISNVGKA